MARGLCGISAAATPACRRERSPFQRCRHEGGAACRRGGHRPGLKLRRPSNFSCSWFGRGAPFFLWLPRSVRGTCRFSWPEPRSGWPRPGGRDPAGYEPAAARGHSGGGTRAQWKGAGGARCRLHMGTRWPIGRPAARWWPPGAREEEAARRGGGARRCREGAGGGASSAPAAAAAWRGAMALRHGPGARRLFFRQRRRCPATATHAASARTVRVRVMGAELRWLAFPFSSPRRRCRFGAAVVVGPGWPVLGASWTPSAGVHSWRRGGGVVLWAVPSHLSGRGVAEAAGSELLPQGRERATGMVVRQAKAFTGTLADSDGGRALGASFPC